ncbi:MAG TPA: TetR/AcrR family transcriptional regulator [Gammaproteobacteria bacterium]|nr:TetR/AcrR family transcriptional regulator [Gammaproteobacteria bacterium]
MARPRNFDPDIVVEVAMRAFWEHGYAGASFDKLVDDTGASRHGIYQEFGDKTGLLLSTLLHYEQTVLHKLTLELRGEKAALPEIRQFFQRVAKVARYDTEGAGCFMCNSHIEMEAEPQIREYTESFFQRLQRLFRRCLSQAQAQGELEPEKNITALSHYLVGLVRGISVNARSNPSAKAYDAYIEVALSVLK